MRKHAGDFHAENRSRDVEDAAETRDSAFAARRQLNIAIAIECDRRILMKRRPLVFVLRVNRCESIAA